MLEYLRIRSLALIEDIEMEFAPGLNVLTGETGAGKSFILKALNFLTGDKLGADLVRPGQEKAQVEALFLLHGEECVLRRELLAATGRSRLFINGELGSQEGVKALKPSLILHTSQHGQQRLLQPSYQNRILDAFLDDKTPLAAKDDLLERLRSLAQRMRDLDERLHGLRERREFLEYQLTEIEKVDPRPGEEEELEARKTQAAGAQAAGEAVSAALGLLCGQETGLLAACGELERLLGRLAAFNDAYEQEREQLEGFRLQLYELERMLRGEKTFEAEADLEAIESRLYALQQLRRKLKRPMKEILSLRQEIEDNLSFLDSCGLERKQLEKEETALAKELAGVLQRCNTARREASRRLMTALEEELRGLGFSEHVKVQCEFTEHELHPAPEGQPSLLEERARFLWLPNPGQAPQPLDKIASGGELSRFLLAIVGLMGAAELPTLIFDEVDAGVGGVTLNSVGERLQALARRQQVLLISHWPQLASLASRHFFVQKEVQDGQTCTKVGLLQGDAVFEELSRMAGGGSQGQAMARELMEKAS